MTIRTILAAAGGGSATSGTLDLACRLAQRFDAHLEGIHVLPDRQVVYAAGGEEIGPVPSGFVETVMAEAVERAAQTRASFEEMIKAHGIPRLSVPQLASRAPSAAWRELTGDVASRIAQHGRLFDLIVLGRSDRVVREPHSDAIETTLVRSGRPVLLAPARARSGIGSVVAVAWNGSPQAVRALMAALPFIERADAVSVIMAGEVEADGLDVSEYLAWHGVNAERVNVPGAPARHIGRSLIDAAAERAADLLVMGAYGHAPWREVVFGGATRDALGAAAMPLMLVH